MFASRPAESKDGILKGLVLCFTRLLLLTAPFALLGADADWPRFRGPNGGGVSASASQLPTEFGPARNVAWKAAVPFGRSSPIVAAGRVFLTAAEGDSLVTLAYDAATGRQLWRRELKSARKQTIYKANDPASPTPAADGQHVYVFFPNFGLAAYTYDGRERWRRPLGPFENFYGVASSPVVSGGLVYLLCDQIRGSFLAAFDTATGGERWRTERPDQPDGWSVPILYRDQLIAVGSTRVDSYYAATGESRWWVPLMSNGAMGSPVVTAGDHLIVTASGSDQPWMPSFSASLAKLDKDGDGKLSIPECKDEKDWFEHFGWVDANHDELIEAREWETARSYGVGDFGAVSIPLDRKGRLDSSVFRWRIKRNLPYVPAPVLHDGVFYMVKSGGIITSVDPATGSISKQGRSEKAPGEYFASPIAADGKIYLVSAACQLSVLKAAAQWEVLAVNDLDDECYATPAASGTRLLVRTRGTLYAFAMSAAEKK